MGEWHIDQNCETALIRLNDELCSFERMSGREYTLILVPHVEAEAIHISNSGKPVPKDALHNNPEQALRFAMMERNGGRE